jgi:hypothetical protein
MARAPDKTPNAKAKLQNYGPATTVSSIFLWSIHGVVGSLARSMIRIP